jgi:LPS-assembly lipoprotein
MPGARLNQRSRLGWARRQAALALAGLALLLGGCGFQLRGAADIPFKSLHVQVAETSPFGIELKRALRASEVPLLESPKAADATLSILSEIREKQILSLGGQGRVREYQLRYRVAYQLRDEKKIITPPSQIIITRDISFNDSEVLAKESEEALLYRDMQADAVQQLLRRLQAAGKAAL